MLKYLRAGKQKDFNPFFNALRKDIHWLLITIEPKNNVTEEQKDLILYFKSNEPKFGYNCTTGGFRKSVRGTINNSATLNKFSAAQIISMNRQSVKNKLSVSQKRLKNQKLKAQSRHLYSSQFVNHIINGKSDATSVSYIKNKFLNLPVSGTFRTTGTLFIKRHNNNIEIKKYNDTDLVNETIKILRKLKYVVSC